MRPQSRIRLFASLVWNTAVTPTTAGCLALTTALFVSIDGSAQTRWVTSGTTEDLSARRQPYHFVVPPGKQAEDIVDIAIDGSNNYVFAWFRGTRGEPREVSAGTTEDLDHYRQPYSSRFPEGYTSADVVGIGIDDRGRNGETTYVFFRDCNYAVGTSDDLHTRLYPYLPAGGRTCNDILSIAMDGDFWRRDGQGGESRALVAYAWYNDGTVSAGYMPERNDRLWGVTASLSSYRQPYHYVLPSNWNSSMRILGIGIDGENNHVYTFYLEN